MSRLNSLSPRIDCFEADFLVLSPIRDQAPAQAIETALLGFRVEPNREDFLARRDVIAYRQVGLRRDRNPIVRANSSSLVVLRYRPRIVDLVTNVRSVESLEERLVRRSEICRRSKSSSIDLPRRIRELRQSRSLISKTVAQSPF